MIKEKIRSFSPFQQILVLMFFSVIGIFIFQIFALLFGASIYGNDIIESEVKPLSYIRMTQVFTQIGWLLAPPILFAFLVDDKPFKYLGLKQKRAVWYYLSAIVICFAMQPIIYISSEWNMAMDLPQSMHNIEVWMKDMQSQGEILTDRMLNGQNIYGLIANIIIISIIPALGEELFFRGVLQKLFVKMTKNIHIGVIITAILFSAFHFQFYGFLPRAIMGLVLGYSAIYTKSLWVPILIHFANNFTAVLIEYLNDGAVDIDTETAGAYGGSWVVYVVATVVVVGILLLFRKDGKLRIRG